jgi:hypothetical protein
MSSTCIEWQLHTFSIFFWFTKIFDIGMTSQRNNFVSRKSWINEFSIDAKTKDYSYLANWRSIRLANELSNKAAWPRPALISDHSTYWIKRSIYQKMNKSCEIFTLILGKRPNRKPLIVPKCSWCLWMR